MDLLTFSQSNTPNFSYRSSAVEYSEETTEHHDVFPGLAQCACAELGLAACACAVHEGVARATAHPGPRVSRAA